MKKFLMILTITLLVSLTLIGTAFANNDTATHTISVTIPEKVEISLSKTNINFDFTGSEGPLEDSLDVMYRCNKSGGNWQLTVSGTDFTSVTATDSFPVDLLKWKKTDAGSYLAMPKTTEGEPGAVVATGDSAGNNTTTVYYQMTMPTDIHAGQYTNTVTYSLIVP